MPADESAPAGPELLEDDVRTLYLDCFSGISGDMLLGVLVDLGVDPHRLTAELAKLHVSGYEMRYSRRAVSAIEVQDVDVVLDDPSAPDAPHGHTHDHDHVHSHDAAPAPIHGHHDHDDHDPHDDHGHPGHQDHGHPHHHDHAHARSLADCTAIIAGGDLSDWVKQHAIAVFTEVARAEAKVHGKSVEEVHFHEVGAVDSIVDITGAFIGLELLGRPRVLASTVHDGTGFIEMAHGRMPVPAPAVAEMLASGPIPIPYRQTDIPTELVTPTGIAILRTICEGYGPLRGLHVERIGYGAGKRDTGGFNALRGILGTMDEAAAAAPAAGSAGAGTGVQGAAVEDAGVITRDTVTVLEANIDDQTGEQLSYARQRLLDAGALDASFTPVFGKKGRPAVVLTAIARPGDERRLAEVMLTETSTLGVRCASMPRYVLKREFTTVRTRFGEVRVKSAARPGGRKAAPEYEDCARLAREHGVPLADVFAAARAAFAAAE